MDGQTLTELIGYVSVVAAAQAVVAAVCSVAIVTSLASIAAAAVCTVTEFASALNSTEAVVITVSGQQRLQGVFGRWRVRIQRVQIPAVAVHSPQTVRRTIFNTK